MFGEHPVSRANNGNIKKVVRDRWVNIWDFISRTIFCKFWYIMGYLEPNNKVWRLTLGKQC